MDQWLIRTAQNWIAGPYTKEQVCKMIMDRQLGHEDEVCSANGYWIYLNEPSEVREQLGIDLPSKVSDRDDITQTSIVEEKEQEEEEDATDPEIFSPPAKSLTDLPNSVTESTGVIDASQFRELKASTPKKKSPAVSNPAEARKSNLDNPASPRPFLAIEVKGQHADTWVWQKLSLILLALAGFAIGIVFLYRVKR
jgi:hypothetical protein